MVRCCCCCSGNFLNFFNAVEESVGIEKREFCVEKVVLQNVL